MNIPGEVFSASAMRVATRFNRFLKNLRLTDSQRIDGTAKHREVRKCLNEHYFASSSETANSMLVGSWGKSTEISPPRDIDVLFRLPWSVYERLDKRPSPVNQQSELLREVEGVLQRTYLITRMKGGGQAVIVSFFSYAVDVIPAFQLMNGRYRICESHNGGSYKKIDPVAEKEDVSRSNSQTKGNTRDLIRMMKCWQRHCNVPMRSFWLERLAVNFFCHWSHAGSNADFYHWMVRDFLAYILTEVGGYVVVPGTLDLVPLGNTWESKTKSAYSSAVIACEFETAREEIDAGREWQEIFGDQMPRTLR